MKNFLKIIRNLIKPELLIIVLALAIGIIFFFIPYNKYLINEDARQSVSWAYHYRDKDLFKNDLLTIYPENYQPWGYNFIYYLFSFFLDPMISTKVLAIFIYTLSTLYIFKIIKHITNNLFGSLAATIYLTSSIPTAALPRVFGDLFLIIFFFYLIKKDYLKTSLIIILQALFYPIVCVLSLVTFLFTFVEIGSKKNRLKKFIPGIKSFILTGFICTLILGGKYFFSYNPNIGAPVTLKQMLNEYQSYTAVGRYPVLPTPSITRTIIENISYSGFFQLNYDNLLPKGLKTISPKFVFCTFIILLILAYKKLSLPSELIYLLLTGLLMFKIADPFLFRLYIPKRYLEHTIPLISFVVFSVLIGRLIDKISVASIRKIACLLISIFLLVRFVYLFESIRKSSFTDFSSQKEFFEYISTLPKDTLIAGPPRQLVDSIPAFSQRKVFLTYELSHPFYDSYWSTIKKRTYDFYSAYYAEKPSEIYKFCQENNIDYLVVNKSLFFKEYFERKNFYFAPFNEYIIDLIKNKQNFVLNNISEENKLFIKDNIFVISTDIFALD